MIVLWVTLLVLQRGYALVPVTTVQLGETVTIPCVLPKTLTVHREVHWYKQSTGDTLKLIWTARDYANPKIESEFSGSRWEVDVDKNFSNLTISMTKQEDEGIYHCGIIERHTIPNWTGTYLLVKGNTQRTSNYKVVQSSTISAESGNSMSLQCSVLSDSDSKSCPGGLDVFWFRAGLHNPHPNIIYTDGKRDDECDKRSDPQRNCVYRFSKNISSSETGTYYCAVATCGRILFGNGPQMEKPALSKFPAVVTAIICLVISLIISLILNIFFICCRTPRATSGHFKENSPSQAKQCDLSQTVDDSTEGEYDLNYAALHFSERRATRGPNTKELETDESVYSQVKYKM